MVTICSGLLGAWEMTNFIYGFLCGAVLLPILIREYKMRKRRKGYRYYVKGKE